MNAITPFQLYLFIKDLILDILCGSLLISLFLMQQLLQTENILPSSSFLFIASFFLFHPVWKIKNDLTCLNLSCDVYNTTVELNQE